MSNEKIDRGTHLNIMFSGQQRSGHWVILETRPQIKNRDIEKAAVIAAQQEIKLLNVVDCKKESEVNKEECTEIPDTSDNASEVLYNLATRYSERKEVQDNQTVTTFDRKELEERKQLISNEQHKYADASDLRTKSHDLTDSYKQDIDRGNKDQEICQNQINIKNKKTNRAYEKTFEKKGREILQRK